MSVQRSGNSPFKFDSGIDLIVRGAQAEQLPAGELWPASAPQKSLLDQLFALPNLQDYLWSQVAPELSEASLLLPHRFWQAVDAARKRLQAAAERDSRNARLFQRAVAVLDDQSELFGLLQQYRLALVAG
ncbi:hypothetical protein H6CHR_01870 [Variovorax sp. PBL-H6]|uniref:type III secretion apparatus assembly protein SctX n=1 Tax=Variovorax sp. PBL-H6 TaxID=434009 RepID=UPI00131662AA|nr:hypothetical protein [Variovorax sp. PBL-H6]VTU22852.1 hypothetical protein H6CHR_01870 [Variovorax sp. PBL-H6]